MIARLGGDDDHIKAPFVIHLIPQDGFGGVESAARSGAEHEVSGCSLKVMYLAGSAKAARRDRVIDHPDRRFGPLATIQAVRDLLKLQPDILICSLWRSVIVGIILKLLRPSTKFVCFLHNVIPVHLIDDAVHRLGCAVSDEIWADSAATLTARVGAGGKTRVISFVTKHRSGVAPDDPSASFVTWCRLDHQKGIDRSIQFITILAARGIDARLDVWGADAGEHTKLARLTEQSGMADRVRFKGVLSPSDLRQVAAGYSFYLQLSRHEGIAMSIVEAMQLGLVPIATAVGQIPHYVRNLENGLIVDPQRLEVAARELAVIIADPHKYRAMSAAAAATWSNSPLYAEDLCGAAVELVRS